MPAPARQQLDNLFRKEGILEVWIVIVASIAIGLTLASLLNY
jgi:hypothetical protein